jgi:hypothetical protein
MRARRCIVAAVESESCGWLAVLDDRRLLAGLSRVTDDPHSIARAIAAGNGEPRMLGSAESSAASNALAAHLAHESLTAACGLAHPTPHLRRTIRRRLDEDIRGAPRHRRANVLAAAARLRTLLERPLTLGMERTLGAVATRIDQSDAADATLTRTSSEERDWIFSALSLLEDNASLHPMPDRPSPARALALIVFGPAARAD